jgi:hypothetical protein
MCGNRTEIMHWYDRLVGVLFIFNMLRCVVCSQCAANVQLQIALCRETATGLAFKQAAVCQQGLQDRLQSRQVF